MTVLWSNPEFVRNARAQLRPGKVAATACICAALSIVIGFAVSHQNPKQPAIGPYGWAIQVVTIAIWLQALMLAAGGGIACVNSIHREKEQNTFDYQRVTRMTPLELALGKLFGAPVFTYFVFLCLMPLALFGAVMGKRPALTVLAAYAVLLVASLAVHTLALLISLLTIRGSHTAAILLLLVILGSSASSATRSDITPVPPLGPFFAARIVEWGQWRPVGTAVKVVPGEEWNVPWNEELFFGRRVGHVPVQLALDLMFAGWFLLALVRNIKKDPNYYEIYSPMQALGFAIYLNLLFVAFYLWDLHPPMENQATLLTLDIVVFFCLGLGAIRNRERVRRILRSNEGAAANWLNLAWPAPLILSGTVAAGLLIVLGATLGRSPQVEWNLKFALVRVLFFAAWVTRDLQFLQWMNLRRGKHPLAVGMLFLLIFYVCTVILMAVLDVFVILGRAPFSAFFVPSAVYLLDHSAWFVRPAIWGAAFVAQCLLIVFFISFQRKTIQELNAPGTAPAATAVTAET